MYLAKCPTLGRRNLANNALSPTLSREGAVGHFIDTRISNTRNTRSKCLHTLVQECMLHRQTDSKFLSGCSIFAWVYYFENDM